MLLPFYLTHFPSPTKTPTSVQNHGMLKYTHFAEVACPSSIVPVTESPPKFTPLRNRPPTVGMVIGGIAIMCWMRAEFAVWPDVTPTIA